MQMQQQNKKVFLMLLETWVIFYAIFLIILLKPNLCLMKHF